MKAIILPLLCGALAGSFAGLIVIWAIVTWADLTFAILDAVSK